MTVQFFLNGRPAGTVMFLPDGTPIVSNDSWGILPRLPVTLFPFLDPEHTRRVLVGLSQRDIVIPRLGVLHVEVR